MNSGSNAWVNQSIIGLHGTGGSPADRRAPAPIDAAGRRQRSASAMRVALVRISPGYVSASEPASPSDSE